jgi:predicted Fe-Mo cluster-binding NifX family protein
VFLHLGMDSALAMYEELVMVIAIPTFGSGISPRFDCAVDLLVVTTHDREIVDRREISLLHLPWCQRIEILIQNEVNTILCGGIRRCDYFLLNNAGIEVKAGLMGEVETVLQSFVAGESVGDRFQQSPGFRRPGWSGHGRKWGGSNRYGRGKHNKSRR